MQSNVRSTRQTQVRRPVRGASALGDMAAPLRPPGHRTLVHARPHGLVCPQVERHASRLGQLLEALELDPRAEEIDRWRGAACAGVRLGSAGKLVSKYLSKLVCT